AGWISRALMGSRRPWGYDYGEGKFSDEQRLRDRTNMGMNVASEVINQMPYVGLLTSTTLGGSLSREGIQGVTRDWLGLPVFGGNRAGLSLGEGKYSGQASEDAFDRAVYWTTYAMSKDLGSRNYFFMGLNHMAQPFYHMSNAQKETSIATKSSLLPAVAPFVPRDFRQDLYEGGVAGVGGFGNKADVKPWHSTYKKRKEKGSGGIRDVRKRKKGNKRRKAGEKRK
ncbi:MAG: hypothetical protein OSB36_07220, partial [Longimicrobiales bacterium]|nr:hypothetical protein [Longimicrobiales bacterium]